MLTIKLLVLSIAESSCSALCVFWIINCTHPFYCYWANVSTCRRGANVYTTWPCSAYHARKIYKNYATQYEMWKSKIWWNIVHIQTSGLPESCHIGYKVTAIPTHSIIVEPVCQITYEKWTIYSTVCLSKNTQLTHTTQCSASTITIQWQAPSPFVASYANSQFAQCTPHLRWKLGLFGEGQTWGKM